MTASELLDGIDWTLLRRQKQWLLNKQGEEAEGLLVLLDGIQDWAVDDCRATEAEVFALLRVHYRCPQCGHGWEERYPSACDSDCPGCGCTHISALSYETVEEPAAAPEPVYRAVYVDVPSPETQATCDRDPGWKHVATFTTKGAAVAWIREVIGPCDDDGNICLITLGDPL